jgi:uncharacterized OB-fold protein
MSDVARVALYLPSNRDQGVPRAGWDEDAFTMAVAAIEELGDPDGGLPTPTRVLLVGNPPSGMEANLSRFFAVALTIERLGDGGPAYVAIARALEQSGAESTLILAVDVGADRTDPVAAQVGPLTDAAVAAWVGSASDRKVALPSAEPDGSPSATNAWIRAYAAHGTEQPDRWVGPWAGPPPSAGNSSSGVRPRPTLAAGVPVSQGAYVPLPRYEENLGSRWRFRAERCGACGSFNFPTRGRCRECGRTDMLASSYLPTDGGTVVATTTIGPGGQPTEFDDQVAVGGPYEVVLAELTPGVRVTLQATDVTPGSLRIGDRIATKLRRIYPMEGEWRYGRKATRGSSPHRDP